MKNKLIIALIVLLCFIPTVVAISSYNKTQNSPVSEQTAVSMTINDLNGKSYTLDKEQDGTEAEQMIDLFLRTKKRAQQIAALPDSLMTEKCFNIAVSTRARSDAAEYYYSTDPNACYMKAADGTIYQLNAQDAEAFITTVYAESLYEASSIPALTLCGEHTVVPDDAAWNYRNYAGTYIGKDVSGQTKQELETYELEGGLNLVFGTDPDYTRIVVTTSDSEILYDSGIEGLASLTLDRSKQVTVDVTAKWYEDPVRTYSGQTNYKFLAYVTAPADFHLGMNKVEAGKFTAITATSVTKPETITVTSTMDVTYPVTFYKADEMTAVGLLAIDSDTPTGLYTITLTYGTTTKDLVLSVENEGEKVSYYQLDEAVIEACRSDAALAEFEAKAKDLMAHGSEKRYFNGSFLQADGFTFLRGFGRDVYLNWRDTPSYRNNGIDYAANPGYDVVAWNAGEVVFAGELTYTGNIVVIEHGYGLKTWYYNMGSVDVAAGDIVTKGQTVGTTGCTGFSGSNGVHIAMSVGEVFVSPYDTWSDSEQAGKVIIAKIDE